LRGTDSKKKGKASTHQFLSLKSDQIPGTVKSAQKKSNTAIGEAQERKGKDI